AFTALVSGNLRKLVPYEKAGEEDVRRVFSMHLHVSLYTPLAFGVRKNGAHLAVVGHRRDVANAKYSDWVRVCLEIGIPVREVTPSWSKLQTLFVGRSIYYKWLEAFAACGYNSSSSFIELTEF
nr:D-aminoacid aminotransferase-like PLP-dependent enzymes superfamily protein [Tanacetum cinerariifolium]